jgi:hypothetical protein
MGCGMKIESIIRRVNGSTVILGDNKYSFVADGDGRHVCEVENEAHVARLLSIKEGFRPLEDTQAVDLVADNAPNSEPEQQPRATRKGKQAKKTGA